MQMQLQLQQAQVIDLEILQRYQGKEVLIDMGCLYGGTVSQVGAEFLHLTNVGKYMADLDATVDQWSKNDNYRRAKPMPDMALARSEIERIVLLEDLESQGDAQ